MKKLEPSEKQGVQSRCQTSLSSRLLNSHHATLDVYTNAVPNSKFSRAMGSGDFFPNTVPEIPCDPFVEQANCYRVGHLIILWTS